MIFDNHNKTITMTTNYMNLLLQINILEGYLVLSHYLITKNLIMAKLHIGSERSSGGRAMLQKLVKP